MRISDWSSDVCSSDLLHAGDGDRHASGARVMRSEKCPAKRSPQNTIAAIVAAAGREFGERGLEGARMENIARRCGKTKQLIYHYYGSKERLFADVVSRNHERAIAELIAYDYEGLEPEQAFRAFLRNMADRSEEHTSELQSLMP